MYNQSPPNWAPNAVPTIHGWVDPKSGELLVSKKGLSDVVDGYGKNRRPIKPDTSVNASETILEIKTPDTTIVETAFVELEVESEVVIQEVKKRRPGRPKKQV